MYIQGFEGRPVTLRQTPDLAYAVIGWMLGGLLRESLCSWGRAMDRSGSSAAMRLKPSSKVSSCGKAGPIIGAMVVSWLPSA